MIKITFIWIEQQSRQYLTLSNLFPTNILHLCDYEDTQQPCIIATSEAANSL